MFKGLIYLSFLLTRLSKCYFLVFLVLFSLCKYRSAIKIIMTEQQIHAVDPESFLPMSSQMSQGPKLQQMRRQKSQFLQGGTSFIYQELKKLQDADPDRKRQCLLKYIKQEGQMKDTSKIISLIQQQGHAIPIMQVAIAISRYDNKFLKQLLDSKTIQQKQQRQQDVYQLNQKMQSDPILCLLSESEQLKKLAKQSNQPTFLDFKQISPKKINELIDMEKGKLKKPKMKPHSMIQYPKQLKDLKQQLHSLPYLTRYRKQLALKQELKHRPVRSVSVVVPPLSQLRSDTQQFGSIMKSTQKQYSLQNTLKQALQKRQKILSQVSLKEIFLPKLTKIISNESNLQPSEMINKSSRDVLDSIVRGDGEGRGLFGNRENTVGFINPEQHNHQTKAKTPKISQDYHERRFWPSYNQFSPHRKRYRTEIEKLQQRIRSITQLSDLPSQSTVSMYTSLKSMETNDLKKLEKQSYKEQKTFSNTKYRIKYKNLKQTYSKRLKQFTKDKKVRQFELQQHDLQQVSNYKMKEFKINDKMLQKLLPPKN